MSRSASGVRQAGDKFQHLVAWTRVLSSLAPQRGLRSIEIEAVDAGNADDIVIHSAVEPSRFAQVKFGTDSSRPVSVETLVAAKPNGTSILQKFHKTWIGLGGPDARPRLQLITNKNAHPDDPLIRAIDGVTSTVQSTLQVASAKDAVGKVRAELCNHLNVDQDELVAFFGDLQFLTGRQWAAEHDHAADLMYAAGLRNDEASVAAGVDLVQSWVINGRRCLSADEVHDEIAKLDLRVEDPWSSLLVQAIDHDAHADDADVALDWVGFYEGETPKQRRRLVEEGGYAEMQRQLIAAVAEIRELGNLRVSVRGAMRLGTWFAVGEALSEVSGATVRCGQVGQAWSSVDKTPAADVDIRRTDIGQGDELAMAIAFAADPTQDVIDFVHSYGLPVCAVITVAPPDGVRIGSSGEANAFAQAIKDAAREQLRSTRVQRLHLFSAAPAGLALLTGHIWNRIGPTTIWEDLGHAGYVPAFQLDA